MRRVMEKVSKYFVYFLESCGRFPAHKNYECHKLAGTVIANPNLAIMSCPVPHCFLRHCTTDWL